MSFTLLKKSVHSIKGPFAWLLFAYLLTPLLYFPNEATFSRTLRVIWLVGITLATICWPPFYSLIKRNYLDLPKFSKASLIVIAVAMVLSTIFGFSSSPNFLLGTPPEFLGLIEWICFVWLGLAFLNDAKRVLLSKPLLYVFTLCCFFSITTELYFIRFGYRAVGVMFHPTTMSMFAVCVVVLGAHQFIHSKLKKWEKIAFAISGTSATLVVIFSQSRIGYILFAFSLLLFAWIYRKTYPYVALFYSCLVMLVVLLPVVNKAYFLRFQSASVERGIHYRIGLYKTSATDIVRHRLVLGHGANTIPTAINNQNLVPEDIAKSLHRGNRFVSTHDLFFDMAYNFGLLSALCLLILTGMGLYRAWVTHKIWFLLLAILFANAIVNVPSIELTPLYLIVLFASLGSNRKSNSK